MNQTSSFLMPALPFLSFLRACLPLVALAVVMGACGPTDQTDVNVEPPPSHLDSLSTTASSPPDRGAAVKRVRSQTLYVPAYSHIYIRDAERSMNLATTLSIRNASQDSPILLSAVEYYDSSGNHVRSYLDTTRTLDPLASTHVVVEMGDIRGGVGANFIVRWHAENPVYPPIVESVMITTASTQGISFRSAARVLYEDRVPASPPPSDTLGR